MHVFVSFYRNSLPRPDIAARRWKSSLRKIDKILIANRGEIACRILRTARRLGIKTVAVYSDTDEHALHVVEADQAYRIGPSPASQSYLCGNKLLEVAQKAGCQAIHPGYGFLSENVEFAKSCENNKVIFIGPPASAIYDMGIKNKSKEIMDNAGVPIIEGYHGKKQDFKTLREEALRIGFPVMIKAVQGGGGKGMRIALSESEFEDALESAKSESEKSFGNSDMLIEKFVKEPRHVEVQIFADTHGNVVHLFERDCSVQRRHQKIIEEAPAPGLSTDIRYELGAAAVQAAKAVGYVGAGTVEFILDRESHDFYFMEMNTRLQVEHPVTEMITGTDLVEWQIRIAEGEKLPVNQEEIKINGHAFEARIYAEDPIGGFLPGAGLISYLSVPSSENDVRIETGVREGDEVSVHYDPMIAKLVVHAESRSNALLKLESLLINYNIAGLETNVNFLLDIARHPEFKAGNVHTNFIKENNETLFPPKTVDSSKIVEAALSVILQEEFITSEDAKHTRNCYNPFLVESGFRVNYHHIRTMKLSYSGEDFLVKIKFVANNLFHVALGEDTLWAEIHAKLRKENNGFILEISRDGVKTRSKLYFNNQDKITLFDNFGKTEFTLEDVSKIAEDTDDTSGNTINQILSPMPGVLDKILVKTGDKVKKADPLFVLIAMKMEYTVRSEKDCIIEDVFFKAGVNVSKDAVIMKFNTSTEAQQ